MDEESELLDFDPWAISRRTGILYHKKCPVSEMTETNYDQKADIQRCPRCGDYAPKDVDAIAGLIFAGLWKSLSTYINLYGPK